MPSDKPRQKKTREQIKREKYTAYLRSIGRPVRVPPDRATAHVRRLHDDYGMSYNFIAKSSGVSYGTLHAIAKGGMPGEIYRTTEEAILATRPEAPPGKEHGSPGARVSPVGTIRRLNSLTLQGFPLVFIADLISMPFPTLSSLTKKEKYIFSHTEIKVREAYDKLNQGNPADFGIAAGSSRRSIVSAKMRGAIPDACWDEDTIDDPDAFPEWTGACGTQEGFRVHRREGIPLCDQCRLAVGMEEHQSGTFNGNKLRDLMTLREMSATTLGAELGLSDDAIRRWVWGQRVPKPGHVRTMASALRCKVSDLLDDAADDSQQIFEEDFSHAAFDLAIKEHWDGSVNSLARAMGVSHTAVHNWRNGPKIPKIETVRKAAEVLGVNWQEFYG